MLPVPYHILINMCYKLKTIVKIALYLNKSTKEYFKRLLPQTLIAAKQPNSNVDQSTFLVSFLIQHLPLRSDTIKLLIRFNETYVSHHLPFFCWMLQN